MGGQITGQAEIQSSINSGIQAINDMQVKQDAAIAAMQEGFNKDDNTIIQKEYDAYQHATDAKDAAIKDLTATITTHNKNLQDFLDAKITEKQAAADEADKVLPKKEDGRHLMILRNKINLINGQENKN